MMGFGSPAGINNDMESDTITVENCRTSANSASWPLESPKHAYEFLIPNPLECQGYSTSPAIKSGDSHKSLNNPVHMTIFEKELAGFIPNLQPGGRRQGLEFLITADISTRFDHCPGKIAARPERASRVAGARLRYRLLWLESCLYRADKLMKVQRFV